MEINYKNEHPTVSISDDVKISNSEKQSVIEKLSKHSKKINLFQLHAMLLNVQSESRAKRVLIKIQSLRLVLKAILKMIFNCMIVKKKKISFKSFK